MISRTYVVVMPSEEAGPTTPVIILVQDNPGTVDAPVVTAGDATYYEWRGRPLRFETVAADGVAGGFTPLLRLGVTIGIVPIGTAPEPIPTVNLSASLSPLYDDVIGVPFPDPSDMPAIRLIGSAGTAGVAYLLSLQVMQAKDEDRTSTGT